MAVQGPGDLGGLGGRGQGAKDGHPIAMALFIFMVFILLNWMSQSGGPLVGCATCQGNVGKFFSSGNTSTTWMLYMVVPLGLAMFVTWMVDQIAAEDEGSVGTLFRQLQAIAPRQSVSGFVRDLSFQGTRREARAVAAQETRRQAQVLAIRGRVRQLEAQRDALIQESRTLKPTEIARGKAIQIQIDKITQEIARKGSVTAQFREQSRIPGIRQPEVAGLPTVQSIQALPSQVAKARAEELRVRAERLAFFTQIKREGRRLQGVAVAAKVPITLTPQIGRVEVGGKVTPLEIRQGLFTDRRLRSQLSRGVPVPTIAQRFGLTEAEVQARVAYLAAVDKLNNRKRNKPQPSAGAKK